MRTIKIFAAAALLVSLSVFTAEAQCKAFAKKTCLPELGLYTHDGNYHAAVLIEGEEAELYKTFYSGMDYRMVICAEETIPSIEFTVYDASRNVIFSNKDKKNVKSWDFKLESSQQLRIVLKAGTSGQTGTAPASGCVSIMFGFKVK
ncbi:MAG: hypothetical protein HPY62_03260 [Bacteroidales bacterium]|nr:hypothetical protein [Bacteroidales bacterium]